MAELSKDEMRVLDAIDMHGMQRADLTGSARPTWDDLLRRGYIEARTEFKLSDKGREVVNERDMSDEPQ
jgi:hypothetical protein